jgi:hypothetical protein
MVLKPLAIGAIADTNVSIQFAAPGPQAPFPGSSARIGALIFPPPRLG